METYPDLSTIAIHPTIATDEVEDAANMYDGFYCDYFADDEAVKAVQAQASATSKMRDERNSRLVHTISAFCHAMNRAKKLDFEEI